MTIYLRDVIGAGPISSRPAAVHEGRLWFDTDASRWTRDSGSAWVATDISQGVIPTNWLGTTGTTAAAGNDPRLNRVYDVTFYGAVGNGTTDDTAAIDAAHAAIPSTGGVLYFPPGHVFKRTSPITARPLVTYRGGGRQSSVILFSGCSGFIYTGASFTEANYYCAWEDLTVRGDYTAGMDGFDLTYMGFVDWRRVQIEKFSNNGLTLDHILFAKLDHVRSQLHDGHGVSLGAVCNAFSFITCDFERNNGWGGYVIGDGSTGGYIEEPTFIGTTFESNRLGGLQLDTIHGGQITGCDFEVNGGVQAGTGRATFTQPATAYGIQLSGVTTYACQGVSIVGNKFSNNRGSATGYHVDPNRVEGLHIAGNEFYPTVTADVKVPYPNSSGVVISNANRFYNGTVPTGDMISHALTHARGGSDELTLMNGHRSTTRLESIDREALNTALTVTSGATAPVFLSYFKPDIDQTIGYLGVWNAGTAAVGATLVRLGLFTVNGSGDVTLVARTASDTTILSSASAASVKPLDITGGFPATYTLTHGTQYAIGLIVVGASTAPTARGIGMSIPGIALQPPVMCKQFAAQSDLPTGTTLNSSLTGTASNIYLLASTNSSGN